MKIAGGEAMTIVRHIDLPIFFQDFLNVAREDLGVKTAERFDRMLQHLSSFLKKSYPDISTLSQITPSVIEAYKKSRLSSTKPHLVNFTLLLLREVLEYGIKIGFINDNPTLHVRLLEIPARNHMTTGRYELAHELFTKDVGLGKACKLMGLTDIARTMYYANLIPLSREDML